MSCRLSIIVFSIPQSQVSVRKGIKHLQGMQQTPAGMHPTPAGDASDTCRDASDTCRGCRVHDMKLNLQSNFVLSLAVGLRCM